MARRTNLVPVELFDPVTGRSIVVYQRELEYPLAEQESRAVYVPPRRREMTVVREQSRAITKRKARPHYRERPRTKRASTVAFCFLMFILSWIPCSFGCPGGTLLAWGVLFSYILYKLVK